jgi:adenine-specific DNA-methyltransferase
MKSIINKTEKQRLEIQRERDSKKTPLQRNKLGQFATPTELAADILEFARTLTPKNKKVRFLDPAFGTGSFYAALLKSFDDSEISLAHGYEIDPHYADPAIELWSDYPLKIHVTDFTREEPPTDLYNLLICNPPYVRHHHLSPEQKQFLPKRSEEISGQRLSGLAGLYCHFLLQSHGWMEEDGIAGWLIPTEFMDVNYGVAIKNYLLNEVELLRIHRFDAGDLQFADALVSSAVVWFRKRKPLSDHRIEFTYGGSLTNPKLSTIIQSEKLDAKKKWSKFSIHDPVPESDSPRIKDFFTIKRGLATGNNSFFILSATEIEEKALPKEFFKPILPAPRYLLTDQVSSDEEGVPTLEDQLFLLDCNLTEEEIKKQYPTLWNYLELGKQDTAQGYICRHRSPWYSQENRSAAPIVCTYMSRRSDKPFRFILNKSKATAANTYLMLYPKGELLELADNTGVMESVWKYLNEIAAESLLREGRTYGGGLNKIEPKELLNVPAHGIRDLILAAK